MKSNFKGFAGNLLFALNLLLLFLLLFESKLVIPNWMLPVGRLHPMILHFPLVLLILAMVMEFFRFKSVNRAQEYYQAFTKNLLLVGALSAAVTAIMGLFLSKEEGYSGNTLAWHKWTGCGIVFIASLIYGIRKEVWYKGPLAKSGSLLCLLFLIAAGHYGASLTHGDNFVLAPVNSSEAVEVPIEQAIVFDHVIQPVLNSKCVSCHNEAKKKGNLQLTDSISILKGGRTGKLFIAGATGLNLFLKRIHLPMDEKKHMPPSGNEQLTPDEIRLLSLWVKGNAEFSRKVIDLPLNDSLRLFSSLLFQNKGTVEKYDFAAADESAVEKLNNDYRDVIPIARESPALAVSLFSRNAYTAKNLAELAEVNSQIVSLNLNKMPVRDEEMKLINQFVNLRKLDLNFTDITGAGLKQLVSLKHLKTLAVSGTVINFEALRSQLNFFPALKTIAVWNTRISPEQVEQLQKQYKDIQFIAGFSDDGKDPIKLNTPQIGNKSTIFTKPMALQLIHPIKGVELRYTIDGSEPDSVHSALFNNQVMLTSSLTVNAKAFKKGWFSSDAVRFDFYKTTYKPDSVRLDLKPNSVHQADGPKSFFDGKMGTFNANSPAWANDWLGFRNNNMELVAYFNKPVVLESVSLRLMIEVETGIYPPAEVEIWGGPSGQELKLLCVTKPKLPKKDTKHTMETLELRFKSTPVSCLKIIAKPIKKIPKGYSRENDTGLTLIDEIFLN